MSVDDPYALLIKDYCIELLLEAQYANIISQIVEYTAILFESESRILPCLKPQNNIKMSGVGP